MEGSTPPPFLFGRPTPLDSAAPSFTFSFSSPSPIRPPPVASILPEDILPQILNLAPSPLERQAARIAYSGVNRHWYPATKLPVEYAVRRSWQGAALALRLKQEREQSPDGVAHPDRKLFLSLVLPLQSLSVEQLKDAYWSTSRLLPLVKPAFHKIRVGRLRCDPEVDTLSPLVRALRPYAPQIRHFQCRIYPWHAKFSAHPFLDLNTFLVAMTNLEFLELSLATRDDLRAPEASFRTDSVIFDMLKTLPKVRHLTLHVRAKPRTGELYAFVAELKIESFSLAIGVEDPKWIDERYKANHAWEKEVPARVREIIPKGVRFTASTFYIDC